MIRLFIPQLHTLARNLVDEKYGAESKVWEVKEMHDEVIIREVFFIESQEVEIDDAHQEDHVGNELSHEDAVLVLLPESLK